jgi:hypothetical protein
MSLDENDGSFVLTKMTGRVSLTKTTSCACGVSLKEYPSIDRKFSEPWRFVFLAGVLCLRLQEDYLWIAGKEVSGSWAAWHRKQRGECRSCSPINKSFKYSVYPQQSSTLFYGCRFAGVSHGITRVAQSPTCLDCGCH